MPSNFDVIPEPENEQELRARVERGEARYCMRCGVWEGLPALAGHCVTCEIDEIHRNMPVNDHEEIAWDMRRAFGLNKIPYRELLSRDASEWDNRKYRGWSGFRCQILFVSQLSPLALPGRWVLRTAALPPGVQSTRRVIEPTPNATNALAPIPHRPNTRQGQKPLEQKVSQEAPQEASPDAHQREWVVIFRVRLWRFDEPGYLQGVWRGDQQRVEWSLHDVGEIPAADLGKLWLPALREARKVGRPAGPPETCEELKEALRTAYHQACAVHQIQFESIPRTEWRATLASHIHLPGWESGMSESTLRDHLKRFKLTLPDILPDLYRHSRQ